ncbi:acidic leucine-rich nuclear phosphoprotein 32 family member A-like [Cucumis melo var. makuwa]|uniref:Acidic leucine-rich nuclear phosphoprotein 32 family member A-like n=1 Tax=Cucumis melo var. makuwa TaxID=1194695 RepID=A0A5D3D8B1_CUCMM|nr:acidic leucine-rich nuclear phosphoprotein 32 family member A-like [Cucumis melo var. makuwa]
MVVGESNTSGSDDNNFYGVLEEVLFVAYPMDRCIWLLKCRWFDTDKNKNHIIHTELGYKSINTSRFLFPEESVILAIQAHQVFYIDDPKNGGNWKVIRVVQNKHIWNVPEVDDVEDQQRNVPEIVVNHRVVDHLKDHTLCRFDIDPRVVEKSIVRHVDYDFINGEDEQLSVQSGSS